MSASELNGRYGKAVIERGEGYIRNVMSCIKIKKILHAKVQGSQLYKTKVDLDTLEGECSCPYGDNCKHAVAAYLYYRKNKNIDSDEYFNDLKTLSKDELIRIIEKIIPENPDLVKKTLFRKKTDFNEYVDDFIEDFSINELENIEENIDCLSFEQLIRILDYVDKNEDSINESIGEDYDSYEPYDDEGDALYDFEVKLKEEIIKRVKTKEQLIIILKRKYMNQEIADNSEQFFEYKNLVKKHLTKEEYLLFLLKLKKPDLLEIKENFEKGKEHYLYSAVRDNANLGDRLSEYLDDDNLRFLAAYYKEDAKNILKYFECFSHFKKFYMIRPEQLVKILAKNKTMPVAIAQMLFSKEYFSDYSEKNAKFLLKNLTDAEFILKNADMDAKFSMIMSLVERLSELKYDSKQIFMRKDFFERRHWTEIVEILRYARKLFGASFLEKLIRFHERQFATSSTLKNNLKKEGIFIQNIRGELKLEIR